MKNLGGTAFEEHISKHKKDFISFKTELYLSEIGDDPIKKADVIRQIVKSISIVPDPIKRSVFFQKCSNLLKIDEQVIISEFNKIQLKKRHEKNNQNQHDQATEELLKEALPATTEKKTLDEFQTLIDQEGEVVRLLLQYGNQKVTGPEELEIPLYDYILEELKDYIFSHNLFKEIFEIYKVEQLLSDEVNDRIFLSSENQSISKTAIDLISSKYSISDGWEKLQVYVLEENQKLEKVAFYMVNRLKWRKVRWMIKENLTEIEKTDSEEDIIIFQQKHLDYKRAEMQLAKILGNVTGG